MTASNNVDGAPVAALPVASRRISYRWRDRRIGKLVIGSLLVHLLLVLLIIGVARYTTPPEPLPPPAVAMLWESGKAAPPSEADRPHLPATPSPPPTAAAPPPPPAEPVAPPLPTAPPGQAETAVAPAPLARTPPNVAIPTPPAPVVASPAPAPAQAAPQTLAARPPPRLTAPLKPPARPQTEAMLRPARPAPSPFSSPMNFSYGPTRPHQPSPSRDTSPPSDRPQIGPTPGPSGTDSIHLEPDSHGKGAPGTDWSNELSEWIESHKYYPDQAAMNGEEGTAEVRVTIDRYGHVKTVELVSRSGSTWLDMASQALFRDRTVPALPSDSPLQTVTFDLTTHYILIRR